MQGPDSHPAALPWREIALAALSLAVALAAAEAFVRIAEVGPTFQIVFTEIFQSSENPALEYELRPGARDGAFRINEAGFRGRTVDESRTPGTSRIVVLGDSVTYGLGVDRDADYSSRLDALLARDGPVEVLNLGVPGYNVIQVAERLRVLGMKYRPDLVIYGYVLNDPQRYSFEAEALRELESLEKRRGRDSARAASRLLAHSHLFLLARQWLVHRGDEPDFYDVDTEGTVRSRGDGRAIDVDPGIDPGHQAATVEGAGRGRRLPTATRYFRKLHRSPEGRARLREGLVALREAAGDTPVVVAVFPLFLVASGPYPLVDVHRRVATEARRTGLEVVDLTRAFARAAPKSSEPLYSDYVHPSSVGHRVAANALGRWIDARGGLR